MNGLNDSINGLNGHVAVAESPATDDGAGQGMTEAKRLELLGQLDSDNLDLFQELLEELERPDANIEAVKVWFEYESHRRNRAKSQQEAAPAAPVVEQVEAPTERETDPFEGDRLMFAEPETYLQPVGHLARYVLAHLLMGEFGNRLFGDDYLDADHFEKVHGLYIDVRDAIAHGFPGIEYDQMLPTIRACENKLHL